MKKNKLFFHGKNGFSWGTPLRALLTNVIIMLDWFLDIYKCPSHRMGNQLLKSRWTPDWHGAVPRWIFHLLTISIFGFWTGVADFLATGNSIALKIALKMQQYFTRYYFSLHKMLILFGIILWKNSISLVTWIWCHNWKMKHT